MCDKTCDIREYLDYQNCIKKIVDSLVEKCSKIIDENEMAYNGILKASLSDQKCNSCTLYIALFAVTIGTRIIFSSVFFYIHWYLKKYPKILLPV